MGNPNTQSNIDENPLSTEEKIAALSPEDRSIFNKYRNDHRYTNFTDEQLLVELEASRIIREGSNEEYKQQLHNGGQPTAILKMDLFPYIGIEERGAKTIADIRDALQQRLIASRTKSPTEERIAALSPEDRVRFNKYSTGHYWQLTPEESLLEVEASNTILEKGTDAEKQTLRQGARPTDILKRRFFPNDVEGQMNATIEDIRARIENL